MSIFDKFTEIDARNEKLEHLKKMKAEREYQLGILLGSNEAIRETTRQIEENNTIILKYMLANDLLGKSRQLHKQEVIDEFEKTNPSNDEEIKQLEASINNKVKGTFQNQWEEEIRKLMKAENQKQRQQMLQMQQYKNNYPQIRSTYDTYDK